MVAKLSKSLLAQFTPLNALNPENLAEIAAKVETYTVVRGKTIFTEGSVLDQHYYLLEGEADIFDVSGQKVGTIIAGSQEALSSLTLNNPQYMTARSKTDCLVIGVDRDLLDILLTWDQTGSYTVKDLSPHKPRAEHDLIPAEDNADDDGDWMTRILQTKAFHRIPPANIQAMFMRMEAVHYRADEVVVQQGDSGDYFYMITSGRCEVSRSSDASSGSVHLATLGSGDSFGEEALISDAVRNATVTCSSDASMMRLSKSDFSTLLKEPLLSWVNYQQSVEKIAVGAQWLDVRLPVEYKAEHIPGSINIPLIFLRMKINTLDTDREYIVCCDTGRRSSAASFLLSERGFERVHTLENGLNDVPEEDLFHQSL